MTVDCRTLGRAGRASNSGRVDVGVGWFRRANHDGAFVDGAIIDIGEV
jgi:hypothetical protein